MLHLLVQISSMNVNGNLTKQQDSFLCNRRTEIRKNDIININLKKHFIDTIPKNKRCHGNKKFNNNFTLGTFF